MGVSWRPPRAPSGPSEAPGNGPSTSRCMPQVGGRARLSHAHARSRRAMVQSRGRARGGLRRWAGPVPPRGAHPHSLAWLWSWGRVRGRGQPRTRTQPCAALQRARAPVVGGMPRVQEATRPGPSGHASCGPRASAPASRGVWEHPAPQRAEPGAQGGRGGGLGCACRCGRARVCRLGVQAGAAAQGRRGAPQGSGLAWHRRGACVCCDPG